MANVESDSFSAWSPDFSLLQKSDKAFLTFLDEWWYEHAHLSLHEQLDVFLEGISEMRPKHLILLERALNLVCGTILMKGGEVDNNSTAIVDFIQNYFKTKLSSYEIWHGRPDFMDEEVLQALQDEAHEYREKAFRRNKAFVAEPGDVISSIVQSEFIQGKVQELYPGSAFSGMGTYIYYEEPDDFVRPHVDIGEFLVNVLVSVDQQTPNSGTTIFQNGKESIDYFLAPGEILIFPAGALFHSRSMIGENNAVTIFTCGFKAE